MALNRPKWRTVVKTVGLMHKFRVRLRVVINVQASFITPPSHRGAKYCEQRVCVSSRIFRNLYVQTSQNFLHLLPVSAVRSFSGGIAIRYVLLVLWMTS